MEADGTELPAEHFGEWRLSFSKWRFGDDGASLTVQIELDGLPRARLSVANAELDDVAAATALRDKARRWIVDYESRPHPGAMGPADPSALKAAT